jgi:hypothetical protein
MMILQLTSLSLRGIIPQLGMTRLSLRQSPDLSSTSTGEMAMDGMMLSRPSMKQFIMRRRRTLPILLQHSLRTSLKLSIRSLHLSLSERKSLILLTLEKSRKV